MIDHDKLLQLIDAIYAAALDRSRWPAVLMQIADAAGASDAALGVISTNAPPFLVAPRTNPEFQASYALHYHPLNLFWRRLQRERVGQVFTDDMLLSRDELESSPFFNEWSAPQGYSTVMGVTLGLSETQRYELQLPASRPFDADKWALVQLLAPHIARSAQLTGLLSSAQAHAADLLSALDRTGKSALLIDDKGRLLLASPAAERMLSEGSGLSIEAGLLVAAKAADNGELRRMLKAAQAGRPGGTALTITRANRSPLSILAVPVSRDEAWVPSYARLLLVISDPEADLAQRHQKFGRHFGLTAAELGIAVEISRGGSRSDVAQRRGVSDATARSQLTAIFDKTGVRRQADLVRLLHEFS
ncbi:hypothetical protein [Devosia sp. FKR38]|uniref:helix-turn-helix transcriptional regulator n=1 Tax=Devosia sp. FKR38 TaxID=2562312 RepID=UPI0010BFF7A7|nr:hypothetical protein [Devosia sp. FKR38]